MKIIIVGAGIAGLSTYLFFHQSFASQQDDAERDRPEIKIYEKHRPNSKSTSASGLSDSAMQVDDSLVDLETLSRSTFLVGGGLGIAPNGMRALRDISSDLHDAVVSQGFPCETFCFRAARGWALSETTSVFEGNKEKGWSRENCVASSRHGLWECLMEEVRRANDAVVEYREVVAVSGWADGHGGVLQKPKVIFQDGAEEEADLIIGADGVKSLVRESIFGKEEYAPIYDKLIGVGGFINEPAPDHSLGKKAMTFTFGPSGFFGYSPVSSNPDSPSTMWWSTIQASELPDSNKIEVGALRKQLQDHHGTWKNPFIQHIIASAVVDHVYPCWTTPELPYWSKDGLILIGDAAHALNPTSGQGSSQALEDAKTLAICLSRFLAHALDSMTSRREAVTAAAKLYHDVRSPRVHAIRERTKKLARNKLDLSFFEEMITYFFFWMVGKFPSIGKKILGDVNTELYDWDAHEEVAKALWHTKAEYRN